MTKLHDIRAALFDFDGTIAETRIDFGRMRRDVLALAEGAGVPREQLDGRYVLELIEAATLSLGGDTPAAEGFAREAHHLILDIELQAADRGRLFPGAAEALQALRDRGIRTAIVTRNCAESVARIRARHPFCCDVILTRDDVPRVKPDPLHLQAALEALGVGADHAVMVGDHPMDVATAKAVGLASIGVLTAGTTREAFLAAGADLVAASVADVSSLIE
jgi:phosphoglycolate phosphatase